MKLISAISFLVLCVTYVSAAEHPVVELTNGLVRLKLYAPDTKQGFYQGTRFDWSGVVFSLQSQGHEYYGPWFQRTNPDVHDFVYEGQDIVAGPCSAITGPVDEFAPVGFDDAKPGSTFIKIGVGVLRKPDAAKYDNYRLYEIANGGEWKVDKTPGAIDFTQGVADAGSGYGYVYRKTIRLTEGKTEMLLQHSLKNTGKRAIHTTVYNHNFLTLDGQAPGAGLAIDVPFPIHTPQPLSNGLAEVRGNQIIYRGTLKDRDVVFTQIQGFGATPADNRIKIEDTRQGAGMTIESDRPLLRESLWSIRTVVAVEPFIAIDVEPGNEFTWQTIYRYYKMSHAAGTFEVKLAPQTSDAPSLGRMSIDKQFHGDLEATSKGEMLSFMSEVKGSAGYVAMERVTGSLHGKAGSFALQHTGTMTRGVPELSVTVVPDSGTGELTGLSGKMKIDIDNGKHSYSFDYQLGEDPKK